MENAKCTEWGADEDPLESQTGSLTRTASGKGQEQKQRAGGRRGTDRRDTLGPGPPPKIQKSGPVSFLFVWTMDRLLKLQSVAVLVWRCWVSVHHWDLPLAAMGG